MKEVDAIILAGEHKSRACIGVVLLDFAIKEGYNSG
jgi:hypothetical protein